MLFYQFTVKLMIVKIMVFIKCYRFILQSVKEDAMMLVKASFRTI
jgi:hypothetical protein